MAIRSCGRWPLQWADAGGRLTLSSSRLHDGRVGPPLAEFASGARCDYTKSLRATDVTGQHGRAVELTMQVQDLASFTTWPGSRLGVNANDVAILDLVVGTDDAPTARIGGADESVSKVSVNRVGKPLCSGSFGDEDGVW